MNVFEKLGGWTLGKKYDEGVLTSIEVNPDDTVTLGLDYGKTILRFRFDEKHQQWLRDENLYSNQMLLNTPIKTLPFNKRSLNAIWALEVRTVGELIEMSEHDFIRLRNCGRKTMDEINYVLHDYGLQLKPITKRKERV